MSSSIFHKARYLLSLKKQRIITPPNTKQVGTVAKTLSLTRVLEAVATVVEVSILNILCKICMQRRSHTSVCVCAASSFPSTLHSLSSALFPIRINLEMRTLQTVGRTRLARLLPTQNYTNTEIKKLYKIIGM